LPIIDKSPDPRAFRTEGIESFPVARNGFASDMRVLLADDDQTNRTRLGQVIQSWGVTVETASDGQEALDKLAQGTIHVLVTDLMMPRVNGFELLKRLQDQNTQVPSIVMTAFGNIETAVKTIHDLGAFWFLEKPVQPNVLKVLLERAAGQSKLVQETERLQRRLRYQGIVQDLVGTTPAMQQVFSLIHQVAPSKASVLITSVGADHWRKRNRQRTGGARDSPAQWAARRAVCGAQLRRSA
jgi:DNA-binding NtrC family response regulator